MKYLILFFTVCLFINTSCQRKLEKIDVDCSALNELLTEIRKTDQALRNEKDMSKIDWEEMDKVDFKNLGKIVSIIEQCGMPTSDMIDKEHITTIFLVIQHAQTPYQKKYLPMLEERAKKGDLDAASIAMMKDRILMGEGKPQIYGTQVQMNMETNEGKLYELANPETVNKRRKEVGLEPIEEYLKHWDVEFNVKQEE